MKKIKRITGVVLTLLTSLMLTLSFAACDDDKPVEPTPPPADVGHEEFVVERIELTKGEGFQEEYTDGEVFNKNGLIVKAYWNDGYVEESVPASNYSVTPAVITDGVEMVTVTYGDASAELTISSAIIVGLTVVRAPTMQSYYVGEVFKPEGMVLGYLLDNGATRAIRNYDVADVTFADTPFALGDESIEVSYNGYKGNVPIKVRGRGFKIEVTDTSENVTMSEGSWKMGTNADLKKMASNGDFMQDFHNGDVMTFTFESDTSQVNLLFQGSSTYVTKYDEITTWAPIVVEDMQVSRVFDMQVNGRDVAISDRAILEGKAAPDGQTASVTYLANWTEVNLGIVEVYTDRTNTVSLTFKDNGYRNHNVQTGLLNGQMPSPYIDYLMIDNVEDGDTVTSIEVTEGPAKTAYVADQAFDSTGMEVKAKHKDGRESVIDYYNVAPNGPLTTEDTTVTISYAEETATVGISVTAKVMTGIEITSAPAKTEYVVGQSFNPAGMVVSAKYNDGTTVPLYGEDYSVAPTGVFDAAGEKTITVACGEFTADFTVTVAARAMTGIEITRLPDKKNYLAGQSFDPAGMTVAAVYNDGTTEPVTDYECTPSGALTADNTEITVSYNGFEAVVPVFVSAEDAVVALAVNGVPDTAFAEGDELGGLDLTGIIVTANYASGKTAQLAPSDYTLTAPEGKAALGSAVVVTLKANTDISSKVRLNVVKKINIDESNLSGNKNYRNNVSWAADAYNGDFVQGCIGNSIITFNVTAASEGYAELILTGASGWVTEYRGLPFAMGEMQANVMFDLEINGELVDIPDSAVFAGRQFETASNNNLANWSNAALGRVFLQEGDNVIRLVFKSYTYENANSDKSLATPNIDYLTVTSVNGNAEA